MSHGEKQSGIVITFGEPLNDTIQMQITQRNICTSLRRKAIKEYFRKKSDEINQDPRQFWATYPPFLHSRHAYKSNDIILKEGEEIITDKTRTVPLKCKLTVSTRYSILDPRSFRESRIEFRGSSFEFREPSFKD